MLQKHALIVAFVAGAASATGFEPLGLWPVTLAALALWMWLAMGAQSWRRTLFIGWAFGIGHFVAGLNWIAKAFTFQSDMPTWLGWIAVVLLSLYIGIYPGLAAMGARFVSTRSHSCESGNPVPDGSPLRDSRSWTPDQVRDDVRVLASFTIALAGCWIVSEWVRSWAFSGFIWNPLGASLPFMFWADAQWVGTYGLSGISIILAGTLLSLSRFRVIRRWQFGCAVVIVVAFAALHWVDADISRMNSYQLTDQDITVVQPNIGQHEKDAPGFEQINFGKLAGLSDARKDQSGPRLIFWPEAAILDYLESGYPRRYYYGRPAEYVRTLLTTLMNEQDTLVLGALALEFDDGEGEDRKAIGARNSIMAVTGEGELLQRYDKAHLVPYGEYLPAREILESIGLSALATGPFDFWEGPGARTIDLGPFGKMGAQLCYEIIFSGEVVDRNNRPDFIFNPSNDAWFGSWGPPQHLAQARLRAIEEGLPVIRATPTGISAVVNADGVLLKTLPLGTAGRIDTKLPPPHPPTLFARYGNKLPLAFAALLIISAIALRLRRR